MYVSNHTFQLKQVDATRSVDEVYEDVKRIITELTTKKL